jgi:uncharacterized NAD(P)/FAD-binding protein YdhS
MHNTNNHDYDVVIVGAGFCGTMVAVHLVRIAPKSRVLVVDKEGAFGRGVAYGGGAARHLLNVPAGKMSAFPEDPDHFFNWINQHQGEIDGLAAAGISKDVFLPRRIYGQYVSDLFAQERSNSPSIEVRETEILDAEEKDGKLLLKDNGGSTITASKLVLALGNFPPGDPPAKDRNFHRNARYLSSPWDPLTLDQISGKGDVLILGAGLTALDLLTSLDKSKTKGTVHVLSRRGLFPQPHEPYSPQPDWFRNRDFPNSIRAILHLLRHEINVAAGRGINWRAIIDALRPHTQQLWKSLNIEERRRFMRHLRPFWESHRHRVAPPVLAVKDRMAENDRVIFH